MTRNNSMYQPRQPHPIVRLLLWPVTVRVWVYFLVIGVAAICFTHGYAEHSDWVLVEGGYEQR